MPIVQLEPNRSTLVVIDVQTSLVPHLHEGDAVVRRITFLAEMAHLLGIPVLTTEQNPSRMGGTVSQLSAYVGDAQPFAKMHFGAGGCEDFMAALRFTGRDQVVVVGVETHICVSLTVQSLIESSYEVVVCPDATGARSLERHKLGMERIRDAGAVPAHTESVAYEWLATADHPQFRDALAIVKKYP